MPAGWEAVIGLETHVQLKTASKIFSSAPTDFGAAPNTQANAVDLALPGTLPVLNRAAVECAIKFGLAVNGGDDRHIAARSVFARKNYFYPDLPKGYQISQYELPVVTGGQVEIEAGGARKTVTLTRAHLEEDAGKSLHEGLDRPGVSGIDLNRAGTPLLEIVTDPVMVSAAEAVAYARALHGLVTWIGICDGNMQEGSFRCDANVSVRRDGDPRLGTRAEIKNVNSFRFLEKAIEFEIRRQIEVLEDGGAVVQETRLYDAERDQTRSMRSKEDAMDYRYFPDPDLLPVAIPRQWVETVRHSMGELPAAIASRLSAEFGLSASDARQITQTRALADYFFALTAALGGGHRLAATWLLGEFSAALNRAALEWQEAPIGPTRLAALLLRIQDGTVSGKAAKEVFDALWDAEGDVDAIIAARGLRQVSDTAAIERLVDAAIAAHPKAVEEYRAGKDKALNALFGQVMKASNKTANPGQVTELLKKKLAG
ncbi:MAG: Asp-tRNA(Asn)/Glu-tRNA(Gln) amidotransferase subunit GatB [Betaproteobacteria bacterium]|nr:Asp-tRNA(Asn)/Glu-tRNA(Gln) amidotransferase subunit GatB [Betaproteobacteria bacterium]